MNTTTAEPHPHAQAASRVAYAFDVLFAVLLAIGALTPAYPRPVGSALWSVGMVAAALAAVYALGRVYERRLTTPRRKQLWLFAVCVLWAGLTLLDANFSWLAFPLYFVLLHLLRPPAAVGSMAALIGVTALAQARLPLGLTLAGVIGPIVGAGVAVLIGYGFAALYRESRARAELVAELTRTRGELASAQHAAGAAAERQRLAREIHDTLAQGYATVVVHLDAAGRVLHGDPGRAAAEERIAAARRVALDNLDEARHMVHALTPPALADAALPEALARLAARTMLPEGPVELRVDGTPMKLSTPAEVALLRVVQEALTNTVKHAEARRAVVTLAYHPEHVAVDVVDDGAGFDPRYVDGGFGLRSMRERVGDLGGTLSVESGQGDGTAVAAAIPLSRGAGE